MGANKIETPISKPQQVPNLKIATPFTMGVTAAYSVSSGHNTFQFDRSLFSIEMEYLF